MSYGRWKMEDGSFVEVPIIKNQDLNPEPLISNPKLYFTMDIENTQAQMRKGVLEFCILAMLSKGDAYPTEIIDRMKNAKLVVVEGTLYPLLTRLKNMGLLSYRWEESNSGPPRKYYKLTSNGKQFLKELEETWDDLLKSVDKITKRHL